MLYPLVCGLVFGSFLSVIKNRPDDLRSVLVGRSRCLKCSHKLGVLDLIPILSFVFLKGKCRYCRKKISVIYPILEIGCALLALLSYSYFGFSIISNLFFLSLSMLFLGAIEDIEEKEVTLGFLVVSAVFALMFAVFRESPVNPIIIIKASLSAVALPLFLSLVSREKWMGYGDSLFALTGGLLVSFPLSFLFMALAFFIGAVYGIFILILEKKKAGLSHTLAFGPFIFVSLVIVVIWGNEILQTYLNLFNL